MAEESTLEDVIERLRAEGQLTRNSGTNSIKGLIVATYDVAGQVEDLVGFLRGNSLQNEENRKEMLAVLKKDKEKDGKKGDKLKIDSPTKILAMAAAAITGLLAGFVMGLVDNFISVLKFFGRIIGGIFKPILNFVKQSKVFRVLKTGLLSFVRILKSIGNTLQNFGKAFRGIGNLISKAIPGGGKGLSTVLKPLKTFFGTFGKLLPTFFKVGRTFGRLFLPFTVLVSLIDFVKGAFEGFQKYKDKGFIEGLIGGILGGIGGLAAGLIGLPLDLLKSAVAWVAGKLGFENFSEMLGEFSFKDLIKGMFSKVTDIIVGFIDYIKETFAEVGFMGLVQNMSLSLLKIFKKILLFYPALAAGTAAAIGAIWPGGKTPMEAFKSVFSKVFNAGDDAIDSMKTGTVKFKSGSEMEVGMSEIANAKAAAGGRRFGSEGSESQTIQTVNTSTTNVSGSGHQDESSALIYTNPAGAFG